MPTIDVLIVCQHNAPMVKAAIDTARQDEGVRVWVWDNGVDWGNSTEPVGWAYFPFHSRPPTNAGFIIPNNRLAEKCGGEDWDGSTSPPAPYLCLLNADTISAPGWTKPLLAAIESGKGDIVGYRGGLLGPDGMGCAGVEQEGAPCDYIEGWCMMMRRSTWEDLGGFDEKNLTLAYGEDSDLCLRAMEKGYRLYVCENERILGTDLPLSSGKCGVMGVMVHHLGGQGKDPSVNKDIKFAQAFAANHAHLRKRHEFYLRNDRVTARVNESRIHYRDNAATVADKGNPVSREEANGIIGELGKLIEDVAERGRFAGLRERLEAETMRRNTEALPTLEEVTKEVGYLNSLYRPPLPSGAWAHVLDKQEVLPGYEWIGQHLPKLEELATQCDHITEFGFYHGVSALSFASSMKAGGRFISVDIDRACAGRFEAVKGIADSRGITACLGIGASHDYPAEETDLLFIDAEHTYLHCRAELELFQGKVRKYIVLHDTAETAWGYKGADGGPGLLGAIGWLLTRFPEWQCIYHSEESCGLTVLERVKP